MWGEDSKIVEEGDFIGNLADVKDQVRLIPPTQNVRLEATDYKIFDVKKDGSVSTWKQIRVTFKLMDGVQVGEETKYKNSNIQQSFVYFANPETYDFTKPFFKQGSYLVPLKQLVIACGVNAVAMIKGGLADETMAQLAEQIKGSKIMGNIVQTHITMKNEEGKYINTPDLQNELKGFKKLPEEMLV